MAKAVKRILCVILLSGLLIGVIPCTHVEATSAPNQIQTGMGYSFLKNDAQRKAYMQLAQDAADLRPVIRFNSNAAELGTGEDIVFVLEMFYADFSEFYWVGNTYGGSDLIGDYGNADGIRVPAYSQEFLIEHERFNKKVFEIIESIPSDCDSEEEIVRYLWNYVSTNVTYDTKYTGQTAYCALIRGEAKCYGYARALSCLLKKVGIASMPVTGTLNGEDHAWNVVWINGECYYIEPQAQENLNPLLSLQEMIQRGYILETTFAEVLPSDCNHHKEAALCPDDSMPLVQYARVNDATPLEAVVSHFGGSTNTEGSGAFFCAIDYEGTNFDTWWQKSYPEIARLLGLQEGYQASYSIIDYDINQMGYPIEGTFPHVNLAGKYPQDHHFPVYEIIPQEDEITFTSLIQSHDLDVQILPIFATNKVLKFTSSNPNVATVNSNGTIVPVGNGSAIIEITADGVTTSCSVTVNLQPHVCEVPLRYVSAGDPDCYNNGNKAYYICDYCGEWFEDTNANQIIGDKTQFTIPATGHFLPDYWSVNECYHYKDCSICMGFWNGDNSIYEEHIDANGDGACDVCNYGAQSNTTPSVTQPNQTTPTQKPTTPTTTPPTQQTSPSDTTDPSETTTPSNPTNPTDSTAPSVPTSQPTVPSNPTESTSSGNPSNPSIESTPETSVTPSGTTISGNPEPGNDDHPNSTWIIYVALLLGVAGIISYLIYKRKVKSP